MAAPPPDAAAMALERPAGVATNPPRAARLKELAFKGALLSCLGGGAVTLAAVLIQIFTKGVGQLDVNFITDLGSSFPEKAGIGSALMGTLSG